MEKITLVCTSLSRDNYLLLKMTDSAKSFDKMLIHTDAEGGTYFRDGYVAGFWDDPFHYDIPNAYNKLIEMVDTDWVCCFCDDDFFYPEALKAMINEVHKGIDADVAHFKFRISGHRPPQDIRGLFLGKEYTLCEKQPITPKLLSKHNRLPAGSFFRKSAWEKSGKFQGDKMHDWNLWLRMAQSNCKFKFYNHLVYNLVRRQNSAWVSQNKINK